MEQRLQRAKKGHEFMIARQKDSNIHITTSINPRGYP